MPKARDYHLTEQELTASELNLIELFWRYLKGHACTNKRQDNIKEVVKAAAKLIATQNSQTSDLKFHVSKHL
jgi:hypothetical protein